MKPLWPARGEAPRFDVVGVGEISLDHVGTLRSMPRFGSKRSLRDYAVLPGGSVATALLAAARLGRRAAFVGSVGDDAAGASALAPLEEAGIDTSRVRVVPGATSRGALVLVERGSGERAVFGHRDARLALSAEAWPDGWARTAGALLVDATDPDLSRAAAREARGAGVPVVADFDELAPSLEALIAEVDFPIVSRGFAEEFSGTGSLPGALERLVDLGARAAVVTLGAFGALAREGDRELRSPAFPVSARDTTGAGDVFHGAFLDALLAGHDLERALRWANAAAALSCLGVGAQGALPGRPELERFAQQAQPGAWRDPDPAADSGA